MTSARFCFWRVSFFFFFFFFFWQHFDRLYFWHAMTDSDQTWSKGLWSPPIYVTKILPGQRSRRGQKVKFMIFAKNVSTHLRYEIFSWNFGTWIVLTFSTKVITFKKCPGSYGVTGVKFKGQIFNFVRFQWLRCQIVGLGPTIKSCHGDPDVRLFLRGQRSSERSIFQLCPISTIEVSNCRSRPYD